MNRFRLATSATLAGVLLAAGCASPCGGCRSGIFQRMSMFRAARRGCPCECCSDCGGGVPIVGVGPEVSEGPLLEPPPPNVPPPPGAEVPGLLPPSVGAPAVPAQPGRLSPIPNTAQPVPAESSSRRRRR